MIVQFSMQSGQTDRNQPDNNYSWEWLLYSPADEGRTLQQKNSGS